MSSPPSRRPPIGRAASRLGALLAPVRFVLGWVRWAPRWMQAVLALTLLAAAGAGGYYLFHAGPESRRRAAVTAGWEKFDHAARHGDEPGMRAALDEVLAAEPGNALALGRRRALDTGEADPGDAAMTTLTLRSDLRAGRHDDALREADKLLAHQPRDWLARCVRAHAALRRGDRDAADRELDQLPGPTEPRAAVSPGGLLYAFQLFHAAGRDAAPLRTFVQGRLVSALRSPEARALPPRDKVTMVRCYLEGFEPAADRPQPPALVQGWAPAARLADLAADEAAEAGDLPTLADLGRAGGPLVAALHRLRRHQQVTAEQFAELSREAEDRTRRAWQAVRAKDPRNAEAYQGLALVELRAAHLPAAGRLVLEGLRACGDDPRLFALLGKLAKLAGESLLAWRDLADAAEREPDRPVLWVLAADAALAAGRGDLARQACAKVREKDPNSRVATRIEGQVLLDGGYPREAAELLAKLGEDALAHDPASAAAFARALAEAGEAARAEAFVDRATAAAGEAGFPALAVAALRGWSDARPADPERAAKVADRADRLLARWPEVAEFDRVRAEALSRAVEDTPPPWDPVRSRAAAQAWERVRARAPDDPDAAAGLGWLRLYAEDAPGRALSDLAPLRTPEAEPTLTADRLELLGAAYRRAGQLDDAIRVLTRACSSSDQRAGCHTQLALAYHARGQRAEARAELRRAQGLPRSPREQADYVAAVRELDRPAR